MPGSPPYSFTASSALGGGAAIAAQARLLAVCMHAHMGSCKSGSLNDPGRHPMQHQQTERGSIFTGRRRQGVDQVLHVSAALPLLSLTPLGEHCMMLGRAALHGS